MRRSLRMGLLLASMLLVGTPERAFALGLGGYFGFGGGGAEGEYDFDSGPEIDIEDELGYAGAGFVLEVHPTGQHLFNYRVNVGFEALKAEFEFEDSPIDAELKLGGIVMDHSFGFAVLRHDVARLWVGPTVRVGFYGGDLDLEVPALLGSDVDGDAVVAELGIGGVFGANFNVAGGFTIGTTVGLRVSGYGGVNEYRSEEDDFSFGGGSVFFNVVFMARTGSDRS